MSYGQSAKESGRYQTKNEQLRSQIKLLVEEKMKQESNISELCGILNTKHSKLKDTLLSFDNNRQF